MSRTPTLRNARYGPHCPKRDVLPARSRPSAGGGEIDRQREKENLSSDAPTRAMRRASTRLARSLPFAPT